MLARTLWLTVVFVVAGNVVTRAADHPVSARKLTIRHTAGGQHKLSFLTKDPTVPFPALGGPDDPMTGDPGGATIELFTELQGVGTLDVPAAVGWFVRDRAPVAFKFLNKLAPGGISPVSSLLLKNGRAIRLRAADTGLPPGALGRVGVRITLGSIRVCALFDDGVTRRDDGRVFIARNATADGLADCSNASLGGPTCAEAGDAPTCGGTCPPGSACGALDLSTCACIAADQPCGDTAPVCNGDCPLGSSCGNVGGFPLPGCGCVPAQTTACGVSETCGGSCPGGTSCFPNGITLPIGSFSWCECLSGPPVDACGGCPPGFHCVILPGTPVQSLCVPLETCDGPSGFPTCGGPCSTGTCQAVGSSVGFCACVP